MKKEDLSPRDFVLHMLEAADRILSYTHGMSRDQFMNEPMVQDAVIRNIEIIGEAANNFLEAVPDVAVHHPSIPFAQIYGMRNRIAHGYFSVSLKMVWGTVEIDIPELRKNLIAVLAQFPEST